MKKLLVLALLAALAYLGYGRWFASAPAPSQSQAEPVPVEKSAGLSEAASQEGPNGLATTQAADAVRSERFSAALQPGVSGRRAALKAAESLADVLRRDIARLTVEINHYGTKIGAPSLRAPASLRNEKAALEYNLSLLLVEIGALRDPRTIYPAARLIQYAAGDFSSIPDWSR